MRSAAVLLVTALLLAGCGSGSGPNSDAGAPIHRLCIVTSLPSSDVGRALLSGLSQAVKGGVRIGSTDELTLCHVRPDAPVAGPSAAGVVTANAAAASDADTVAYIGEITSANATVAAEVLREEGVPMITAAPPPAGPAPSSSGAVIYLRPPAVSETTLEKAVISTYGCARSATGHIRPHCLLTEAPFCTGIATTTQRIARFCVSSGPDLSRWPTPAQAYGDTAGRLLIAALRAVSAAGENPADRGADAHALLALKSTSTPVGSVRVAHDGTLTSTTFSLYRVASDGTLVFGQALRAH